MKSIQCVNRSVFSKGAPAALVVPAFKDEAIAPTALLDADLAQCLEDLRSKDIFRGAAKEVYSFGNVLAIGLGKRETVAPEILRRAAGKACADLSRDRVTDVVFDATAIPELPVEAFAEGLILGQYRFDRYKSRDADDPAPVDVDHVTIVFADGVDTSAAQASCDEVLVACTNANWARDLACTPSNDLTPANLADAAKDMAREVGCSCEIFDEDRMAKLGMNALLGVARGSEQRARLIIVKYTHADAKRTLLLVGKGLTFDSGGISIKPGEGMQEMKYDMCGAAAVLGAMKTIATLKPAINVIAVVPAVENMPGGNAQKPGDIVKAYNGKTIEVNNTDAEGRLVLADAMAYAVETFKPDAVVDAATLTGAVIVALGHYAAGMLGTDDALCAALEYSAKATGERVWRLPLWDDYDKLTEGTHADLSNIGPPREAGAIMGAAFLKPFVGDVPWVHLDIAGTAWGGKNISYLDANTPTGYGVRLLTHWVLNEAARF